LFSDASLAINISEVLVLVAIPLILFSSDFLSIKKLTKPILISFLLILISVFIMSTIGFALFHNNINDADKVSGMLVGLYTGGTPNLMAIGIALGINSSLQILSILL